MNEFQTAGASRYIDKRLPLWGMLTAAGAVSWILISMYFTTLQTAHDVSKLQAASETWSTQLTTLTGEQALLRFRMTNIEGDVRDLKSSRIVESVPTSGVRR